MAVLFFKKRDVDEIVQWARTNKRTVELVHDNGLYLMAGFKQGQKCQPDRRPGQSPCRVAYAKGFSPKDPDVWERARYEVGGDDFSMPVPLDEFKLEEGRDVRVLLSSRTGEAHTVNFLNRRFEQSRRRK